MAGNVDAAEFVSGLLVVGWSRHDVSEQGMKKLLMEKGPLAVCVSAETWQLYKGGVMRADMCSGQELDHCLLLVGWSDSSWLLKNSWGTTWGEDGYIRLEFGTDACGLADQVSSVEIATPDPGSVCKVECGKHGACMDSGSCACDDGYTGVTCETPPPTEGWWARFCDWLSEPVFKFSCSHTTSAADSGPRCVCVRVCECECAASCSCLPCVCVL